MKSRAWRVFFIALILLIGAGTVAYEWHQSQQDKMLEANVDDVKINKSEEKTNGIVVLCYHRVTSNIALNRFVSWLSNNSQLHEYDVNMADFKSQIRYLNKHHVRMISVAEMTKLIKAGKPLKHQYAVVTFDDIDETTYQNAAPYLEKQGIPFTVFVVTNNVGVYREGTQMSNWKEVKALAKSKHVTIGSHTNNLHTQSNGKAKALTVGTKAFMKDFETSVKKIKHQTGQDVKYFAYPYGEGTKSIQRALVKRGIVTFSLNTGVITEKTSLKEPLPRLMVTNKTWQKYMVKWVK